MTFGPEKLQRATEGLREVAEVVADDIPIGGCVVIKTAKSMFIFESTDRHSGATPGKVTRFSEAPMTTEGATTYLPDVIVVEQPCLLFAGQTLRVDGQTYFHDLHYPGQTYKDGSYDVIHTAPIVSIGVQNNDLVTSEN
jgi:hypothetical protein